jgi:ceramide glucosyltransferase
VAGRRFSTCFAVEATAGVLAAASLCYTAFALSRVIAFGRRPVEHADGTPWVTVLKPLHGAEPWLAEKLRSFCDQDYPAYDVILGARDAGDAALAVARGVAADFGGSVRVVSADRDTPRHVNPKANTLAGMVPHARGEIIAIADSDMRVDRGWLHAIVAPFADPRVGAVTCLYRGEPADASLASALGSMANHEHFAPSGLVAQALGPLRYTFGATMAVRREVFEAVGGLAALGTQLADDARLGELVARHGMRVYLSRYVVANVVAEPSLRALWQHEVRWARTHRMLRPGGYAGLCLTYPVPLALLYLVAARGDRRAPFAALATALALRFALRRAAGGALGARPVGSPWLVPLRDALGLVVWCAAYRSRDVDWSGDAFTVTADGTLSKGR